MQLTDVVVIGAGQAGLAMSRSLASRSIEHVVLERGRVGERWLSERWTSLRLLTPASHSALPGMPHTDVDGGHFLEAREFARYLDRYAERMAAPVAAHVAVTSVEAVGTGFRVATSAGPWRAKAVVLATGACDEPHRPAFASALSGAITQIVPRDYGAPADLPAGGVLVVGASSTGLQLAEEIHMSGRPVTLAVGNHTRMPRRHRGLDIFAAMDLAGILDDAADACSDLDSARRQPSAQLVGRSDQRDIDLAILSGQGVRLVGRLAGADGRRLEFHDDLAATSRASHGRMLRTIERIDRALAATGADVGPEAEAIRPFVPPAGPTAIDLVVAGIRTIVWATGYVRRYPWLKIPVLDPAGEIVHRNGRTSAPGLYVLGQKFMRRRRSHFIDGCGRDAEEVAAEIERDFAAPGRRAA
jgi:putative flavoprotein involved in K+ transport